MSMGCVMVAGGAGYIGSHAVRELRRAGRCVAVLDNLSTGHRAAVEGAEFLEADIRDTDAVYEALKAYEAEAVMHFAADSRVGESQVDPEKYYGNNVCGTFSLLSAMRRAGVNRLVFSSTAAVYGDAKGLITEEYPKRPANVYGRTKWMIEQMLADFDAAYGLKAVALRYFNAAGATRRAASRWTTGPRHLIPLVLGRVNREPLTVFEDDYPTRDGTNARLHPSATSPSARLSKRPEGEEGQRTASATGRVLLEVIRTGHDGRKRCPSPSARATTRRAWPTARASCAEQGTPASRRHHLNGGSIKSRTGTGYAARRGTRCLPAGRTTAIRGFPRILHVRLRRLAAAKGRRMHI